MCCPCRRREMPMKMPTTEAAAVPAPGRARVSRSSREHLRLRAAGRRALGYLRLRLRYERLRAAGRRALEYLRLRLRYEHLRAAGRRSWLLAALAGAAVMSVPVWAQTAGALPLIVGNGPAGSSYSVAIQTLLFFTALTFLPAVLLMMTGFTRIVIVLSLLRQALGTQSVPPNQIIIGLSLLLTFFVMGPTFERVYQEA